MFKRVLSLHCDRAYMLEYVFDKQPQNADPNVYAAEKNFRIHSVKQFNQYNLFHNSFTYCILF